MVTQARQPKGTSGSIRKRVSATNFVIYFVVIFFVVIALVPMIHELALSLSGRNAVAARKVSLWPVDFNTDAYTSVFYDKTMVRAMWFTIALTFGYTVLSVVMTSLLAYPLSKPDLPGRTGLMIMVVIPMYFSGGIIAEYMWIKELNLLDNPLVLLLPLCISSYNTIILINFFKTIPDSLIESAWLDGCSEFGILVRIVLPLSKAALATIALFYAVSRWNGFQDVLYYINKSQYFTLQMKLYQIVYNSQSTDTSMLENGATALNANTVKAASIMFASIPILLVYPFLQKYFVQGVMIGAVKG